MNTHKEREKTPMTNGFQHQRPLGATNVPKTAARPQHGQKAEKDMPKLLEQRSFQPRPGH